MDTDLAILLSMDTAGNAQIFLLKLAKEMHLKRNVKFSVFALDYGEFSRDECLQSLDEAPGLSRCPLERSC